MKKSLLALAVLACFAGAASAQSSVTLWGQVDANVQHLKAGDNTVNAGDNITKLQDGHVYGPGSRWGLKVIEDLGGGLTANVQLESGFNIDSGTSAQGGRLFGRQAWVSVASAAAGEIRLGRQYILSDEVIILNNPFGNATVLNTSVGYVTGGTLAAPGVKLPAFLDATRIDNVVQYRSPNFAGFSVQLAAAPGEGTTDRYQAGKLSYSNGPLNVATSYETTKAVGGARNTINKTWTLGGNYNFGPAKVFAGYQRGKDLAAGLLTTVGGFTLTDPSTGVAFDDLKAYTIGASVPLGAFTLGANYVRTKYDLVGGGDKSLGRFAIGANYSLSKLTTLYTAYGTTNGDLKEWVLDQRVFQFGLRKAF